MELFQEIQTKYKAIGVLRRQLEFEKFVNINPGALQQYEAVFIAQKMPLKIHSASFHGAKLSEGTVKELCAVRRICTCVLRPVAFCEHATLTRSTRNNANTLRSSHAHVLHIMLQLIVGRPMKLLALSNTDMDDAGLNHVSTALSSSEAQLTELSLDHNKDISLQALRGLMDALRYNSTLARLSISNVVMHENSHYTDEYGVAVAAPLAQNRALKQLTTTMGETWPAIIRGDAKAAFFDSGIKSGAFPHLVLELLPLNAAARHVGLHNFHRDHALLVLPSFANKGILHSLDLSVRAIKCACVLKSGL
jgi:hypothetical protein